MDRQYMPYWQSGPGQYPPVKEEPDYSKMGYEDTPGGAFTIKREPNSGPDGPPSMGGGGGGYGSANVKIEVQDIKQELVEPKQEPSEERRGEKRQAPNQFGPPDSKRYRSEASDGHADDDPDYDKEAVILDWYNSDLSLVINKSTFLSAEPMTSDGFGYVWHGVRATYGFLRGRVWFEVKIEDHIAVPHLEGEQHPNVMRCGWSVNESGLVLGEEPFSYGYGGTGKASTDLKFKDYGRTFAKGDVVGCFLDMDSEPIAMSFSVNGRSQGKCYEVSHRSLQGKALFPHILTKNCSFKVNFGSEYPWFQPLPRYEFVGQIPLQDRVLGSQGPQTREESEVLMMVGLPACGKSTWVEKYCKENMEKKYYVLGTNFLIDKMKVNGLSRKRNYHGRWDVLIDKCTKCLNKLLGMSYKRKRNFIIDQTNVYPSARRRKMKGFNGFYRRAMVLCPTDAELQKRTEKQIRQEGKNVPDSAIMEMKANFTLPEVDDEIFDSVEFLELQVEEASRLVDQYSKDAQRAGYVKKPAFRGGRGGGGNFRRGWNRDRNSNNNRGGYNRDNFGSRDSGIDQSSDNARGGFGRDNNRGSFGRGGFNNRGGFDSGNSSSQSRFDRSGDSNSGGFDRGGGDNRGFDQGGYDNRGGFGRGGGGGYNRGNDGNRGVGFGRGGGFGNRDVSRGYNNNNNNMDRDNQGYGRNSSDNSYQDFNRDSDRDSSRGYSGGDSWNSGSRDDNSIRGRYGQDNFGRNRDTQQRGFDGDRDNRSGDRYSSGGFGQSNFSGGNRDMQRGFDDRSGNRDFGRGGDNSRGGYGRDSYSGSSRDSDNRGYGQDSFGSGDSRGGFGGRDSQRGGDRDFNRGGSSNSFGGFGSRSYSLDRERDSRGEGNGQGQGSYGYGNRGFGSHDNLSRNMGNQGGFGGGGGGGGVGGSSGGSSSNMGPGGYSNQDQSDSSGYSSLSSSQGSLSSGQSYGNGWNRQFGQQQQQQYWGQSNSGGYGGSQQQQGSGMSSQQSYSRPYDQGSSPGGGSSGGGSSSWGQHSSGSSGNYGGSGGNNQQWNYGSSYRGQRQ